MTAKHREGVSVNTKPTQTAANDPPDLDRYMPGDPIPVAQAVEANTESTWALFEDVPRPEEPDFQDTVPVSLLEERALGILPKKPV